MKREDCFADAGAVAIDSLLLEWRWLIGPGSYSLLRATALGDLFISDERGRIHFLDTMDGRFSRVADSEEDLARKLDDRANRNRWLMTRGVELARMSVPELHPGQCYGWKIHPAFGGEVDFELNVEPTDLLIHHSIIGQLFRQVRMPK